MNYGDLKSHFNDLLNRSDITTALTTRFIDQGDRPYSTPASDPYVRAYFERDHHEPDRKPHATVRLPRDHPRSIRATSTNLERASMRKYRESCEHRSRRQVHDVFVSDKPRNAPASPHNRPPAHSPSTMPRRVPRHRRRTA